MKKWTIGLLAAGLCLALAGCGGASVGQPDLSQMGGGPEMKLTLPESLPLEETAQAYRLAPDVDAARQGAEATLGEPLTDGQPCHHTADGRTVEIDQTTGHWTYTAPAAAGEGAPISDQEALAIAESFVRDQALWTGPFASARVEHETAGGGNQPEEILGKDVYFYPRVEGKPAIGRFRTLVSLDPWGEITGVLQLATPLGEGVPVTLKSRQELAQTLAAGVRPVDCMEPLTDPVLTQCSLVYYTDGEDWLYPVYALEGEGTGPDGSRQTFQVLVDAQR